MLNGHYVSCHLSTVTKEEASDLGWMETCDCSRLQEFEARVLEACGVGMAPIDDELEPLTTVKVLKNFGPTLQLLWIMPVWAWSWGWQVRDVLVTQSKPEGDLTPELRLIRESNTCTDWEFNLGPLCLRRRRETYADVPSDMQHYKI